MQRALKFSHVLGTTSVRNSMMTLPTSDPPIDTFTKTFGRAIFTVSLEFEILFAHVVQKFFESALG